MPRDDFARLERRWREQPMFLPRRRRLPIWPLVLTLFAMTAALGATLFDRSQFDGLVTGLEQVFRIDADAPNPKAASTAAAGERPGVHRTDR